MTKTNEVMSGGCLCGAVRYKYDSTLGGDLGAVTICHCRACLKAQGGPVAAAPAFASAFRVTAGIDQIREFQSSPGKFRAFCEDCGSPLFSRRTAAPTVLRLRLGALDNPPLDLAVKAHIHVAESPAWTTSDDVDRYNGEEPARS